MGLKVRTRPAHIGGLHTIAESQHWVLQLVRFESPLLDGRLVETSLLPDGQGEEFPPVIVLLRLHGCLPWPAGPQSTLP